MAAGKSIVRSKIIRQDQLTSDCWNIQIWGLSACENCEARDTDECGGEEIRTALLAGEDYGLVGIDGLPDQEEV